VLLLALETSVFYGFSGAPRLGTNGGKKNILMLQFWRPEEEVAHYFYGFSPDSRALFRATA
jgi:hypothetical protein